MAKLNKILSLFLIIVCFTFGLSFFVEVNAASNGIGTVNQTYSRTIVPGAVYTYTESDNGKPQKNYVLEYNAKTSDVEALAVYGEFAFGGDTLSKNIALAESKGYTVIAGVNGSPFDTSNGTTTGTLISNGRIISSNAGLSGYDSFAIKSDGTMFIGKSNLSFSYKTPSGKVVNINTINKQKKTDNSNVYLYTRDYYSDTTSLAESTEVILKVDSGEPAIGKQMTATVESVKENTKRTFIEPGKIALVGKSLSQLGDLKVGDSVTFDFVNNDASNDWSDVLQSINGFYEILKDGEPINTSDPAVHPRTTIGFKADGSIVLYVVDGRQPTFSVGLTDLACAEYMKSLGCVAAIRMDGGGSSTMALRMPGDKKLTTVNSPSDGGERNDADGLLICLKSDYNQTVGSETLLHAYPNNVALLENTVMDIEVKATDKLYNAKETPEYKMEVEGDCGTITSDNKFKAKSGEGTGKVKITSGDAEIFVDVKVTNKVDEIYATVNNLALSPNEKVKLNVKAYCDDSLLICSNESFKWEASAGVGTISESGEFTATSNAGVTGYITVSHGNASFKVMVTVGQLPVEITGFETDKCGTGSGQWRNTQVGGGSGSCEINDDLNYVRYGTKSLKINFNLAGTTGTVGTQISTGSNLTISGTPTAIGMWVYATPSAKGAWIRLQYSQSGSSGALYADFGTIDWTGWKYLEAPIDGSVNYPISIKFLIRIMGVSESQRINGVIYVDNLRAVYGFSNDDFVNPVISNITPKENGLATTTTQTISFDVTDDASGVKKEATEFYLDGNKIDNILFKEISGGYNVSWTPSSLIPLTVGEHKIKVRVEDNYQNYVVKEWDLVVNTSTPSFNLSYEKEVSVDSENYITLKASNKLIKSIKIVLGYDESKVTINEIKGLSTFTPADLVKEENKITAEFTNKFFKHDENDILQIKFKALSEGEVNIEIISIEYEFSEIEGVVIPVELDPIKFNAKVDYDFDNFINLVNKVDKDNILTTLEELNTANQELANFDQANVTREDVLAAIKTLDEYNKQVNTIFELLAKVKETSSGVGKLLGGN